MEMSPLKFVLYSCCTTLSFVSKGHWRDEDAEECFSFHVLTQQVPAVHTASSVPNSYNGRVSSTQLPLSPISDDFGNEGSSVRHLSMNIFLWQGAFRQISPEPYYSGFSATQESLLPFPARSQSWKDAF